MLPESPEYAEMRHTHVSLQNQNLLKCDMVTSL